MFLPMTFYYYSKKQIWTHFSFTCCFNQPLEWKGFSQVISSDWQYFFSSRIPEAHLEPNKASKMELFARIIHHFQ